MYIYIIIYIYIHIHMLLLLTTIIIMLYTRLYCHIRSLPIRPAGEKASLAAAAFTEAGSAVSQCSSLIHFTASHVRLPG